jgi:MerR family transcriptional regulator/heat shock protein HspR
MREPALFAISVAAELAETGAQTPRDSVRGGVVDPPPTTGGTRRYSRADVDRVIAIRDLLDAGLNLAGVERVLDLEAEVDELRARLEATRWPGADPA